MKKVLSFVLSVAMVICLMPAMAFAATDTAADTTAAAKGLSQFTDADSINNKEAVAVLVGLGVIDGMGDGTFAPQGDLTRAQAAKLVCTVLKSGDKTDIAAPAEDPFTDVAKTHWAAGAIAMGVSKGFINGMGDGTFAPDAQVTTAQLATMLEKVLGYTVEDVNKNWPDNAMSIAQNAGLLENITASQGEALNREEAAQMIFNALLSTVVTKTIVSGSDYNTYEPVQNSADLSYYGDADDTDQELIEKYFPKAALVTEDNTDGLGHESTVWKNGRETITDEVIDSPTYVYTDLMAEEELTELDGYILPATMIQNGEEVDFDGNVAELTGNGTVVELYTNVKDTAIEKIITYDYAPYTVAKNDAKNGYIKLVAVGDDSDNPETVFVNKGSDAYSAISSAKKDAVVLAVANDSSIEAIDAYLPESATGKFTKATKDTITFGGKEYTAAATCSLEIEIGEEGTVYVDEYGYLEAFTPAEEETPEVAAADYLLAKKVYQTEPEYDKYGDVTTPATWYVLGVNEEGKVVELPIAEDSEAWAEAASAASLLDEVVVITETKDGDYTISDADASGKTEVKATTGTVKAKASKIDGTYVSTDVTVVTVTGDKASKIAAEASSELPALVEGTKYVVDSTGKVPVVRTVFVEKEAETPVEETATLIRIVETTALVNYTNAKGEDAAGIEVTYYAADSADLQTMIIPLEDMTTGWAALTSKKDGEACIIQAAESISTETENILVDTIGADSTYNGIVTIDGVDYTLSSDLKVRDLREDVEDPITTAEDYLAACTELSAEFAYDATKDGNVITQLYIVDEPDEA